MIRFIIDKLKKNNRKINFILITSILILFFIALLKKKEKIQIFDLTQELIPEELYNSIQCRKSAEFIVTTYLCVHKLEKDQYVSGSIIKNGVWESQILGPFTNYLNDNPDWLVLDVGAQIGDSYYLY